MTESSLFGWKAGVVFVWNATLLALSVEKQITAIWSYINVNITNHHKYVSLRLWDELRIVEF